MTRHAMMRRAVTSAVCLTLSCCGAATARAESVPVEVVDVAGGRAYVQPGEIAGVRRGGEVTLGKRRFRVIGATDSYAITVPHVSNRN